MHLKVFFLGLLLAASPGWSAELKTIAEIHGESATPNFLNQTVTTEGIVTLVLPFGFWIQTPSESPGSSRDGLHVFTGSPAPVGAGDRVRVTGLVDRFVRTDREFDLALTRLIQPSDPIVLAHDQPLPPAVIIGPDGVLPPARLADDDPSIDPEASAIDFWTHFMGMRMQLDEALVIAPSSRFGDTWVLSEAAHPGLNEHGVLTVTREDDHLDRVLVSPNPLLLPDFPRPALPGDRYARVDGVVHYEFGQFRLLARHALRLEPALSRHHPTVTRLSSGPGWLRVASYNVENLNPVIERLGRVNGPRDVDDAIGSGRMARLGRHIAVNLGGPEIVALQEIQDNNGAELDDEVSADRTYQALISAIESAGGPRYAFLDPVPAAGQEGGQPGGNIRNGFLYDPARVTLLEPGPVRLSDPAFDGSRRPVLVEFEFNGHRVGLINNHFSSKWGSSPQFGVQPAQVGGVDERPAQAAALRRELERREAWNGARWIVLGDLNDHWFSETLTGLKGEAPESLVNLIERLEPEDRWTYVFSGLGQAIDHILATPNLAEGADFEVVHVNAATVNQAADHEPIIARFHLPREP